MRVGSNDPQLLYWCRAEPQYKERWSGKLRDGVEADCWGDCSSGGRGHDVRRRSCTALVWPARWGRHKRSNVVWRMRTPDGDAYTEDVACPTGATDRAELPSSFLALGPDYQLASRVCISSNLASLTPMCRSRAHARH